MSTDENNQDVVVDNTNDGEGKEADTIAVKKSEWDNLNQSIGSMKRELKDLKKPKEDTKETPQTKTEEFGLLHKTYLRSAGLTSEDEIELAKDIQKKTGVDWDKLPEDEYFQSKLQKLRDGKANARATDVEGGSSSSSGAKNDPAYWMQKGSLPTEKDVPDRKTRASIARTMAERSRGGGGGKFYNE